MNYNQLSYTNLRSMCTQQHKKPILVTANSAKKDKHTQECSKDNEKRR